MNDVLGVVLLAGGDEPLHPLEVVDAVLLVDGDGLRRPGADVGAGIGLGEHHRPAPLALDHRLGPPLDLLRRPDEPDDRRHEDPRDVEEQRRVRPDEHLLGCPPHEPGSAEAPQLLWRAEEVPVAVEVCVETPFHAVGEADLAVDELERSLVGLDEAGGEVLTGESLDLAKDVHHRVPVEILEGSGTEIRLEMEHLEEVELDVAQVALVMAHIRPLVTYRRQRAIRTRGAGCVVLPTFYFEHTL